MEAPQPGSQAAWRQREKPAPGAGHLEIHGQGIEPGGGKPGDGFHGAGVEEEAGKVHEGCSINLDQL